MSYFARGRGGLYTPVVEMLTKEMKWNLGTTVSHTERNLFLNPL